MLYSYFHTLSFMLHHISLVFFSISIDITHVDIEGDSDERLSEGEDPDYEPSILISSIL